MLAAGYRLIGKFGLWAAIATALIYVFVWEFRGEIRTMRYEHLQMFQILGATCLNGAEDPLEVARCNAGGAKEIPEANYYR